MNWHLTGWIAFPLFLAVSFLLSGMEAGVFALSRPRIRQQMRTGRPSARVLYGFLENPENFLWTIFVGNTLANFFVLGWCFFVLYEHLAASRWAFAAVFIILVVVFYAFFDLLPKMLFRTYPNRLSLGCARVFGIVHLVLRPVVTVVEACSRAILWWTGGKAFTGHLFGNREELLMVMQESGQAFTSEERTMINRVLELSNVTVRQIAHPLADAVTVNAAAPVQDALNATRAHRVTRLPVWEMRDGRQRIAGLVAVDRLLLEIAPDATGRVGDYLKPALYVDEDERLESALRRMQRARQPLAVVLDRQKREWGIVSLTDILKTIFGEVRL